MPAINVRVDHDLWSAFKAQKPHFLSDTAYLNLVISDALEAGCTLAKPLATLAEREILPLNKEEEVKNSKITKAPPQRKIIDQELLNFEDLIREFWKIKGGTKSDTSWKLLMSGLKAIQEMDGDKAVETQLQEAINGKWKGISLRNYLQFKDKGKPKPWQQEPSSKHPAHQVFVAEAF